MKYKNVYLHSPRNPEKEAENILRKQTSGKNFNILFVLDSPESIYRKVAEKIFSVPVIQLIPAALGGENSEVLIDEVMEKLPEPKPALVIPPVFGRLFPEFAVKVQRTIIDKIRIKHAENQTEEHFKRIWRKNIQKNLHLLKNRRIYDVQITGPVMIIASGPSLEKEIKQVIKHSPFFFKIGLPSALPFLRKSGINVDAVVMTDPSVFNRYYVKDIPDNTYFVFSLTANHLAVKRVIERVKPVPALSGEENKNETPNNLKDISGSTCATSSLKFAVQSGAKRVVFVGEDLSFEFGKMHCRGNPIEEKIRTKKSSRLSPLQTIIARKTIPFSFKERDGIFTSTNLSVYKKELEMLAKRFGEVFILNSRVEISNLINIGELKETDSQRCRVEERIYKIT